MLVPSLWKHPLSPDWLHFWTPLSRAFRRLFLPWRPPKSKTLLNVPPYILFYNPLFKFLRRPKRERKKTHPLFKRNLRVKSQIPPFFFNSRAGLCRTKSTPLPEMFGTRMRSLRPRSGGGGAGCAARETPIFSPEFPFRSISFSQISKKSVPEHHHFTFFGGFCRSGDHHLKNFFNFNPFIASHGRLSPNAAPRVSQTRPGSSGESHFQRRGLARRVLAVPESPIFSAAG